MQKNTQTIFETFRTEADLNSIVEEFRKLLNIGEEVKVKIVWGRKAKRVLGSVRLNKGVSVIRISKYLEDFNVPEYVLQEVILHELIHVKTGYGSVLEKEYQHAHRGGVIRKEMESVGKADIYDLSNNWIKENWYRHIRSYDAKQRWRIKKSQI